MSIPQFIERNAEQIKTDLITYYQQVTGKVLNPAQPEMLLINTFAYRELLIRESVQSAGLQMLVDFATAPALDYLGTLVGVQRLPSSPSSCIIRFTLIPGHSGVVIPIGTRVRSQDGSVIFATVDNYEVVAGLENADVLAASVTTGITGNGFAAGTISKILDPQAYILAASNLSETSGGAAVEGDEALRSRIKLAPDQFTTGGTVDAYRFHTFAASPDVVDVAIDVIVPGTIGVYPLVSTGAPTPPATLQLISNYLNKETIRVLTDTVQVLTPTAVSYSIDIELTLYSSADALSTQEAVEQSLQDYVSDRAKTLGKDIVISQIRKAAMCNAPGVYDVGVISPIGNIVIAKNEVPSLSGAVSVTVIDTVDG